MKKLGFLAAIASLLVSSCKKNYNCTCTYTGGGLASGKAGVYVIPNVTKQEAQTICDAYQAYPQGGTQTTKCSI